MDGNRGGKFRYRRKAFTAPAGMERLGASLYEIESGASASPRHCHCANEEAIFVLEGEGLPALGESATHVRAGDFIALPRGAEHAQRLSNSSQLPLRYRCFSTTIDPDMGAYPDSMVVGFFAGSAPGGPNELRRLAGIFTSHSVVGYFERREGRLTRLAWEVSGRWRRPRSRDPAHARAAYN